MASEDAPAALHDPGYVKRILALRGKATRLDLDTAVSEGSVDAALLALGGALEAVERVWRGDASVAFALVRPPGHHAERDRACGFCLFGNAALAADHAVRTLGAHRPLIVDFDVHHGNGTQHLLEDRADVAFVSLHQRLIYPGTGDVAEIGEGEGRGATLNLPLPAGSGDADYALAFDAVVRPFADRFRPDLVVVSAGFDAHERDPLAGMRLTDDAYARMGAVLRSVADDHASGRLAVLLEGGYDLQALANGAEACLRGALGQVEVGATPSEGETHDATRSLLGRARSLHEL